VTRTSEDFLEVKRRDRIGRSSGGESADNDEQDERVTNKCGLKR
jgi:hypothetical protein